MTRKEEIKQKALSKYPQGTNRYNKFIEGAKYADSTFLDKVEKYLRAKIILYTFATTVDQREEWFNDFRKAVEE